MFSFLALVLAKSINNVDSYSYGAISMSVISCSCLVLIAIISHIVVIAIATVVNQKQSNYSVLSKKFKVKHSFKNIEAVFHRI